MLNLFKKSKPVAVRDGVQTRFERKFFIRPEEIGLAYALLRQVCRPDADYPDNIVQSLYFDTAGLDQYHISESGEIRKNKVRIRWYDRIQNESIPVFVELKTREGFASSKQRTPLTVPACNLAADALGRGIIDRSLLISTLAGFGFFPPKPLKPVIYISYRRYRFNEITAGIRVSLDFNITATSVAPEIGSPGLTTRLAGGVVEIKGRRLELPPTLRRLKLLDTDWTRFSKYSNCIDSCLAEPGSVARNWPSGKTNLT